MTEVPRRLPRTPAGRSKNVSATHASLSGDGQSKAPRPVNPNPRRSQIYNPNEVVVGDTAGLSTATAISLTRGHGALSTATAAGAVAIGSASSATANNAIAIGSDGYPDPGPVASGSDGIAIGRKSAATVGEAIAIGKAARSVGFGTVAIGGGANADGGPDPGNLGTIAIGSGANAVGTANIAIGSDSEAVGAAMALGAGAKAYGNALAIVGEVGTPTVPVDNAVAIGHDAHATADHDFILGSFLHHVIVNGALIIADNTGGLHQIVVDTSGVLSTVTYP